MHPVKPPITPKTRNLALQENPIDFRKQVYTELANRSIDCNLKWAVLHGIEGLPESIGRDLDVICQSSDDEVKLFKLFHTILVELGVEWILSPNPIWGRRMLGITHDFNAVELHSIGSIRTLFVEYKIKWDEIAYQHTVFPVEQTAVFFKAAIMPALVNQKNWQNKSAAHKRPKSAPKWMASISTAIDNGHLTSSDKVKFLLRYFASNPATSLLSLRAWGSRKINMHFSKTTPIFLLKKEHEVEITNYIKTKMGSVFQSTICLNDAGTLKIKRLQSMQNFLYSTQQLRNASQIEILPGSDLGREVMNAFANISAN